MKLLITGGNGFLGKHVVDSIVEKNFCQFWAPSHQELDLLDVNQSLQTVSEYQPDAILHMAALCRGILANKTRPADFLHHNVDMASTIFHCAKKLNIKTVYSLGTVCAYPKFAPTPFKEDDIWNGFPEETNAPYGVAKRLLLMMGQAYRQQYDIGGAHFVMINLYGENDHFNLQDSHVIPALIRKIDHAMVNGLDHIECWGTGTATREFLYIKDAADAITKAVELNIDTPLPINLGTGREISIKDLSVLVANLMGYKGKIIFTGEVSDGQPKRMLDVSRARDILQWESKISLENGIIKTIHWYLSNKDQIISEDNKKWI